MIENIVVLANGMQFLRACAAMAKVNIAQILNVWMTSAINGLEMMEVVTDFFMAMQPPTKTHQEKQVRVVNGKPVFYEPAELKAVRQKLRAHLGQHVPEIPFTEGPVRLTTWWCFPRGKHKDGTYKTTKPDTDNLVKMLKDVMTELHFWQDDAQVASEVIEKYWAELPGIYVKVESI